MATLAEPREATSDEAFREEVRAFLADHFPPELKGKGNALASVEGPTKEGPAEKAWREAMGSWALLPAEEFAAATLKKLHRKVQSLGEQIGDHQLGAASGGASWIIGDDLFIII